MEKTPEINTELTARIRRYHDDLEQAGPERKTSKAEQHPFAITSAAHRATTQTMSNCGATPERMGENESEWKNQ